MENGKAELISLLTGNGSSAERVLGDQMLQNIQQQPPAQDPAQQQQVQQPVVIQGQQQQQPADPAQQQQFIEIDTPAGKIKVEGQQQAPPKLETFEDAFKVISSDLGMPIEKPQDVVERLAPAIKDMRKLSSQAGEAQTKYTHLEQAIASLPDPMKAAIEAYASDPTSDKWLSVISNKTAIPFSKNVDEIDKFKLVEFYYPGQTTEDALSSDDDTKAKELYNLARERYVLDKSKRDLEIKGRIDKAAQLQNAVSASIEKSVESISKYLDIPTVDEGQVLDIKHTLSTQGVDSLFKDENGAWKEDAAARVLMAKHGPEILKGFIKYIQNIATSKANEQIVDMGGQSAVRGSGNQVQHQQVDEATKMLQGLLAGNTNHYS